MRLVYLLSIIFMCGHAATAGEYVAFKTWNNRFIVAEGGGGGVVNANRIEAREWETFYVVHLTGSNFSDGATICISAHSGHYLSADNYDIVANRGVCNLWEEFQVVRRGDKIALKTWQNRYVVAENGEVNANRIAIGAWELFTVINK